MEEGELTKHLTQADMQNEMELGRMGGHNSNHVAPPHRCPGLRRDSSADRTDPTDLPSSQGEK